MPGSWRYSGRVIRRAAGTVFIPREHDARPALSSLNDEAGHTLDAVSTALKPMDMI